MDGWIKGWMDKEHMDGQGGQKDGGEDRQWRGEGRGDEGIKGLGIGNGRCKDEKHEGCL